MSAKRSWDLRYKVMKYYLLCIKYFLCEKWCIKIMKLNQTSILWAIKHLFKENDTDLFPKPLETAIRGRLTTI